LDGTKKGWPFSLCLPWTFFFALIRVYFLIEYPSKFSLVRIGIAGFYRILILPTAFCWCSRPSLPETFERRHHRFHSTLHNCSFQIAITPPNNHAPKSQHPLPIRPRGHLLLTNPRHVSWVTTGACHLLVMVGQENARQNRIGYEEPMLTPKTLDFVSVEFW
jgi:hypothetical protein